MKSIIDLGKIDARSFIYSSFQLIFEKLKKLSFVSTISSSLFLKDNGLYRSTKLPVPRRPQLHVPSTVHRYQEPTVHSPDWGK